MTASGTPDWARRWRSGRIRSCIFQDFGDIFGDIFGFDMFGQGGRRRSRASGADLREDLNLEFEEAVFGVDKK